MKHYEDKKVHLMNLKVSNDLIFQKIFGKVGNEAITKRLIEKILGINIKKITLNTNKRMQLDNLDGKIGRLDVKAELEDGRVVHIEMQASEYEFMEERFVFYNDAVFLESIKRGKGYRFDKNKVIGILITDYNLKATKGIEKYHTIWDYREKEYTEKTLIDNKQIHIIELKKFKETIEEDKELAEWVKFLKVKGMEDMRDIESRDEALEKAKKELEILASNREAQEEYIDRENALRDYIFEMEDNREKGLREGREAGLKEGKEEGIRKGIEEGRKEGRKEGKIEERIEIAKNMIRNGMSVEEISKFTNIKKEEIEKLKQEIK